MPYFQRAYKWKPALESFSDDPHSAFVSLLILLNYAKLSGYTMDQLVGDKTKLP